MLRRSHALSGAVTGLAAGIALRLGCCSSIRY
jgi:hypothetical protein